MISKLVVPILSTLMKPLMFLFGALLIKRQGAKEARLKGKEQMLNEAKEALKDKESISNMSDNDLADIVLLDDERRGD